MMTNQDMPGRPDQDVAGKLARLVELEETASGLRHDLLGMLTPAFLFVDQLLEHPDPNVVKAGETVLKAIKRAEQRLVAMRGPSLERVFG